ncbi:uncharacterized protein NPIL_247051 [Nephila pilipes]|uniref:Uncharacterized protein n=1 Tax=Nephila pilipes TaxID=299642 RepID=A0A8X6PL44_NEPPI|nr:uncharacterized protein NPIL_247051 [Nephila pilipes]
MLPIVLSLFYAYLAYQKNIADGFWALGHQLQCTPYGILAIIVGEYMYFTLYLEYPCLFVISICTVVYHYGLLLLRINTALKEKDIFTISEKLAELFIVYNAIEKKIRFLTQTLSTSLLILVLICSCNLFTLISYCQGRKLTPFVIFDLCSIGLTGLLMLFSLTVSCSRIPEYMMRIKATADILMDNHVLSDLECSKSMNLLKRFAKKDPIYLTAGGILNFKKRFLLSAFGTLFTYGLLILNINRIS